MLKNVFSKLYPYHPICAITVAIDLALLLIVIGIFAPKFAVVAMIIILVLSLTLWVIAESKKNDSQI